MKCDQSHRYVIANNSGDTEVFTDLEEAKAVYEGMIQKPWISAVWIAFHEVGIARLVANPDTIETYCSIEAERIEAEYARESEDER